MCIFKNLLKFTKNNEILWQLIQDDTHTTLFQLSETEIPFQIDGAKSTELLSLQLPVRG